MRKFRTAKLCHLKGQAIFCAANPMYSVATLTIGGGVLRIKEIFEAFHQCCATQTVNPAPPHIASDNTEPLERQLIPDHNPSNETASSEICLKPEISFSQPRHHLPHQNS